VDAAVAEDRVPADLADAASFAAAFAMLAVLLSR
jgi:hypothetical protein